MYEIVKKRQLNENMFLYRIKAPLVARKARAGQFIILRVNDHGERIPLTVADTDPGRGLVTIIFQVVGKTTEDLSLLSEGECLQDFVGPLGKPTELDGIKKAVVIGGGAGIAIAYPQAKALKKLGADVSVIAGFRTRDLVILEKELKKVSDSLYICTNDGSYGRSGFVTDVLDELIPTLGKDDAVIAIGPLQMMKAVSEATRPYGIRTVISMNSIMLDGTGMCGACRLTVGGETKFACVDGPDFDGHLVDFDEAILRNSMYRNIEREEYENHSCRLMGGNGNGKN